MRYLVHLKNKDRTFYFWEEENKTHTVFACEKGILLEEVSSVGYVLYNPDSKNWILAGAISWSLENTLKKDKKYVLDYIQEHFDKDMKLKKRLSTRWNLTQQKNAAIIKKNPFFAGLFKLIGREHE